MPRLSAQWLLREAFSYEYFGDDAPIQHHWVRGRGPLVVVVGDNATGKSFLRRMVRALCDGRKVEHMGVSMEFRQYGGMARALVYGDESWQATGICSINSVLGGISTCRKREHDHVIFWDEPDLGLSDSYAAGMGRTLLEFASDPPEKTRGIFITSHNKRLLAELRPAKPHFVQFGGKCASLDEWLGRDAEPKRIEDLGDEALARFRRLDALIRARTGR